MKILHTADIHLREYGDDRWRTLQQLIEVGKKERVEIFVISGDLFDKDINADSLRPKIREIFSNTGFKIVLIPGNHDINSYAGGKYFGEDIEVLNSLNSPFEYKDVRVWGMPFEPIDVEKILSKLHSIASKLTTDKKNILLYHGELLDAFFSRRDFGEEGEERYMPIKLSYFKDLNIDYVLAGHFHSKFDFWELENGRYFVYPGSPVSITKREIGRRSVNLFEVGKTPMECYVDTFHYEELVIELDPSESKDPVEIIKERLTNLHPNASTILTVKGFINSEVLNITEDKLIKQIKELAAEKNAELFPSEPELTDIQVILEDDLFKSFMKKLEQGDFDEEKKKWLRNVAIKAMMEARL